MPHEFEVREEIALDASPEQVWEAIATGPGVDSWFMGRNEFEPREGGAGRMTLGGYTTASTVTVWEPAKRFAFRSEENPDGTFMAFEYLIEGRDGGSTVLQFVHSGFLGDDWEAEYEAMSKGDAMYLRKLATYLRHFPGRTATHNIFSVGRQVPDTAKVWATFLAAFGLSGTPTTGDPARLTVDGLEPVEGTVEFASHPTFLSMRTDDGIYVLIHGMRDTVVAENHGFAAEDAANAEANEQAWQAWLTSAFG
jgi:uncharacterized protein YndB with AHSA1/START domain